MTTTAVVATPHPLSAAPRAPSAIDLRAPSDHANSFDRQLGTARQQLDPHRAQAPSRDSRASAGEHQSSQSTQDQSRKLAGKPAAQPTATPAGASPDPGKQTVAVAPAGPLAGALDDAADKAVGDAVKAAVDSVDGSAAAASLAGAMLALLPSASAALQALTGNGSAGKAAAKAEMGAPGSATSGAAGQGGAGLLPMGDAGASALRAADNAFVAGKADLSTLAAGVLPTDDHSKETGNTLQASALLAPLSAAGHASTPLLQVQAPVGSSTFGQELGQQVAWLGGQAGQGVKQASIRLNPQELGPLDVKISMDKGRVDVVFSAQHPAAVTAVQQTLPQLGHMLAQHGLSLGHAEVGQQQGRTGSQDGRGSGGQAGASSDSDDVQAVASVSSIAVGTVSLLDAFA